MQSVLARYNSTGDLLSLVSISRNSVTSADAYTDDDDFCPTEVGHVWKYRSNQVWQKAGRGIRVMCDHGCGMITQHN